MQQLIGQQVRHQVFGTGVVTDKQETTLTVQFPVGEKMFMYPDAFASFLVLCDETMQNEILDGIKARQQKEHEQEMIAERKWRKEAGLRNMHISARSQAIFDIAPEAVNERLTNWDVSTGTYASGYSKGEPRVPDRMKPNSMCVLTVRPEGKPEADRYIAGMFMVEDTFEGNSCQEGVIHAHPEYRLNLTGQEPVLFWPYVTQEDSKKKWGNTTLKYLPNTTVQQMLNAIKLRLRGTDQGSLAEEIYGYYCRLNRLDQTK